MDPNAERIVGFVNYVARLKGDEKGEAQVFCDRLFQAFGHAGYNEAGATLEWRVTDSTDHTKFADLVWKPRLLLEMKSRGQKLERHYRQAFEYWLKLVPHRPRYVMLCNFDELWVYDFDLQLEEPVDRIRIVDLPERYTALNFMFPEEKRPLFGNDRVAVTRAAADKVAAVFNGIIGRDVDRKVAQRFILQCVVAMFSEDAGLLPSGLFTQLLHDCKAGQSSYDLIGGLFKQMNNPVPAPAGRYQGVPYFNGGVFAVVEPLQLAQDEIEALLEAVQEDWSKVQPVIFGSIFESSMDAKERHAYGAHFTSEADIQKVIMPTIVRPWQDKIAKAKTFADLRNLRQELLQFRVLDPACGSGNFLYVAYRELKHIELDVLTKMHRDFPKQAQKETESASSLISTRQFFGLDTNSFAVELAKVTLMLAKELTIKEVSHTLENAQQSMAFNYEPPLPLDNLDKNIVCADALFTEWPKADAIVGNPPYLGSRYLAKEHGYEYAERIYARFPDVPKMADFCTYWFRLAQDNLPKGGRAGLVGTNTIRQNESREASLDYIIENGGTLTEAVSTQVWSGDAAVHVSIVNWVKGKQGGTKKLFTQLGDSVESAWKIDDVDEIPASLSLSTDVSDAKELLANQKPKQCYQGQNPVNEGFFLQPEEARELLRKNPKLSDVIFPYMIGRDLIEHHQPTRYIIDFAQRDMLQAMQYPEAFERVKEKVMPTVLEKAEKEKAAKGTESTRWSRMANRWWQFRDYQPGTMQAISAIPRYIVCARVTKRPIFEFVSNTIHPDNALVVFPFADDYSFGVLQSNAHWEWFKARCSTLKGDFRYTSDTVFNTFPWAQQPSENDVRKIAEAAQKLRAVRREWMKETGGTLRDLYRSLELSGENPLRNAHTILDAAVQSAYGMNPDEKDVLAFLLKLNKSVAAKEAKGGKVLGPGLPVVAGDATVYVSQDCVTI
jgi:hypothetical protein